MKEANIKKLFVKFFTADSGSKSLLVDERSTTAHVLKQLADKHRITLTINHAIVEAYPDLCMGKYPHK
jgi:amyloid beta A4 precursor protein-binding family B protein 1-interacting protein